MNRRIVVTLSLTVAALTLATTLSAEDETSSDPDAVSPAVNSSRRQLWRADIEAPVESKGNRELQDSMRRLEAIHLPRRPKPPWEEPSAPETAPAATSQPAGKPTTRPAEISKETLAALRILTARGVVAPAMLAEAFFFDGRLDSAATFYEMALATEDDPIEKAWMLLQIANCRVGMDPQAASAAYGKVTTEHADTLWSPIAQIQKALIDWRHTDELTALLREIEKHRKP